MNIEALHLAQLFVVGTFWFWALLLASVVLMIVFGEVVENGFFAFLTFIATLVVLQLFTDANVIQFFLAHPLLIVGGIFPYMGIGAGYSIPKWWSWVRDRRHHYDEIKERWLEGKLIKGTIVPPQLVKDWENYCHYNQLSGNPPSPREHKSRIVRWITYWPTSLIWTILNDPIRKLANHLYHMFQGIYERIAENAWKGVADDFRRSPEPERTTE